LLLRKKNLKREEWKQSEPFEAFPERRKCHWKKFLKNNCSPVVAEEKPLEKPQVVPVIENPTVEIEKPLEKPQVPVIEKPTLEVAPIAIEKPVAHKYEKTLVLFEEMGFLSREKNIAALDKAKGDAKLAVSVLLGL